MIEQELDKRTTELNKRLFEMYDEILENFSDIVFSMQIEIEPRYSMFGKN